MKRLLTITLLVWLVGCAASSSDTSTIVTESSTEEPFYAWDFTMDSLSGESYTLADLRGRWVLINFWATWCGPCRDEMPILQIISEDYANRLTVLGINQRESRAEVESFRAEYGLGFPLLLNPDDQTLINYQVVGLPQTLIVDPNGEIVWRQFGPLDLDSFQRTFAELVANYS